MTYIESSLSAGEKIEEIFIIILESVGQVDKEIAFYCERILAVRGGFARGRQ